MNKIINAYQQLEWDKYDRMPKVIIHIVVDNLSSCVSLHIHYFNDDFDIHTLSLYRLVYKTYTATRIALFEIQINELLSDRRRPDVILGFIPHRNALKSTYVSCTLLHHATQLHWETQVYPKNVIGITPFLFSKYMFPYVQFLSANIDIHVNNTPFSPTILCANVAYDLRQQIADEQYSIFAYTTINPKIQMPNLHDILEHKKRIIESKKRHAVFYKELMEKFWAPSRFQYIKYFLELES